MILLVLTCLLLGIVIGALFIIRIDAGLAQYLAKREGVLITSKKKPKTFKPVILEPDTMYLAEEKAENLRKMTGAEYDESHQEVS